MSQALEDLSGEPSPRPTYLRRLDELIKSRRGMLALIDVVAEEFGKDATAKSLRHLAQALRNECTADEVLNDPALLGWLPWIVHDTPNDLISKTRTNTVTTHDDHSRDLPREHLLERLSIKRAQSRLPWQSLLYPAVLVLLAVIVFAILSFTVIPVFARMFREFGLRLPFPTKIVFGLSDTIQSRPLIFMVSIALLIAAVLGAFRLLPVLLDRLSRWSIVGYWTSGTNRQLEGMARFLESLAAMITLGAPLEVSLKIAALASKHWTTEHYGRLLAMELSAGDGKSANDIGWKQSQFAHNFPRLLLHVLASGESSSTYASVSNTDILQKLARCYRIRVQQRFSWFSSFLGPIAIVLIGCLIGIVVIALFLPLISLVTSLSG